MRYFFKFDSDGSVTNWQIAETDATAARLGDAGYVEVTKARYVQMWRARDMHERTVGG
jgi:hypothetical protein